MSDPTKPGTDRLFINVTENGARLCQCVDSDKRSK